MNVYRWVHLDSEGFRKDGPFYIHAKDKKTALEYLNKVCGGFTFSESDTTSFEFVEEIYDKRQWIKRFGVWD